MNSSTERAPRRSRMILILVFALFSLPLAIAWVMNFVGGWTPHATTNHGELIQPVRPLNLAGLVNLDGDALDTQMLHGKWTLLYLHEGACDKTCYNMLYTLRQVRLAQGKNIDRIQRLLVLDAAATPAWAADALTHYPGLLAARLQSTDAKVLTQFPAGGRIYLVDPLGNLMMQYPVDAEPGGMIKDLERLLMISYVG